MNIYNEICLFQATVDSWSNNILAFVKEILTDVNRKKYIYTGIYIFLSYSKVNKWAGICFCTLKEQVYVSSNQLQSTADCHPYTLDL